MHTTLCSAFFLLLCAVFVGAQQQSVWKATACVGSWSDPSSWMEGKVPTNESSVLIPSFGEQKTVCKLQLPSTPVAIRNLTLGTQGTVASFALIGDNASSLKVEGFQWLGGSIANISLLVDADLSCAGANELEIHNSTVQVMGNAYLYGNLTVEVSNLNVNKSLLNTGVLSVAGSHVVTDHFTNRGLLFGMSAAVDRFPTPSLLACQDLVTSGNSTIQATYMTLTTSLEFSITVSGSASLLGNVVLSVAYPNYLPAFTPQVSSLITYKTQLNSNFRSNITAQPPWGTLKMNVTSTSVLVLPYYELTMTGRLEEPSFPAILSAHIDVSFVKTGNQTTFNVPILATWYHAYNSSGQTVTGQLSANNCNVVDDCDVHVVCKSCGDDLAYVSLGVQLYDPEGLFCSGNNSTGQTCELEFHRNVTKPSPPDHQHSSTVIAVAVTVPVVVVVVAIVIVFIIYRRRRQYNAVL